MKGDFSLGDRGRPGMALGMCGIMGYNWGWDIKKMKRKLRKEPKNLILKIKKRNRNE